MAKAYSANEITFLFGGVPLDSGRGDSEFLKIAANAEKFSVKTGIDGEATFSENKDATHILTLTMMQSSDGNDILSAVMIAAEASGGGVAGVVPVVVKDNQGSSLFASLSCVIAGWPEQTFAQEVGVIQWKIFATNPKRFIGGNSST